MDMMHDSIRAVSRWLAVVALVSTAAAAGACAKAQAETAPDGPPLQMPEPPQRVLVPVEIPVVAETPPEPVPPPVATAPAPPPRPPAERRPAVPAAAPPAPPPPPVVDTRELRTASPTTAASERMVRDMLARAQRDLGRVNYMRLSADGRAQYEQSKRFSTQAEEALRERNLIFAATLADKAATLAAELAGS
jgi:type IV secretory pathway VirB10-like protein